MEKQQNPEIERKRAWLNRYRESLAEQRRIAEQLEEARDRSTSICVSLNPAKAAPTNAHSDRVADSVQRITTLEKKLQDEQQRGQNIATEIINALYDQRQLTLNQIRVLCCQYIDGLSGCQNYRAFRATMIRHFIKFPAEEQTLSHLCTHPKCPEPACRQ